jgi:hypothetical protein
MLLAVHIFVKFLHLRVSSPKGPTLIEAVWKEGLRTIIWQQEGGGEDEEETAQWGISQSICFNIHFEEQSRARYKGQIP